MYALHPGRARRWREHPGIERVQPGGRAVLTFDDGPDVDATPGILDALDRAGATATFFVVGEQVLSHPALAQEIVARGHEIGLHCNEHVRYDRLDAATVVQDIDAAHTTLRDLLGVGCRWCRPPYGKLSTAAAEACRALNMTVVYWSAWGLDWEEVSAQRIASTASRQLDDGGIVLLHDSARYGRRATAAATAEAIPLIAAEAAARGLSLEKLGDAVDTPVRSIEGVTS